MANSFIVGEKGCSISKILFILQSASTFSLFYEKWSNIARDLDIDSAKIKKLRQDLLLDRLGLSDVLYELLELWVANSSSEATLQKLMDCLVDNGLTNCKELLENQFIIVVAPTSSSLFDFVNCTKPLEVKLKPLTKAMNFSDDGYKLPVHNKGYVFMINIIEFENPTLKPRRGAEIDAKYMTSLWTTLGYKLYPEPEAECTMRKQYKQEILADIENFKELCKRERPASIIVFIGSHGGWDKICTSDYNPSEPNRTITLNLQADIVSAFSHKECPVLENRPKLFIVETCQGFFTQRNETDAIPLAPSKDTMIVVAQMPGFTANVDIHKGSHFIYCLTHIVMNFAGEMSFQKMIEKVKEAITKIDGTHDIGQLPVPIDFNLKPLYFTMNPGY